MIFLFYFRITLLVFEYPKREGRLFSHAKGSITLIHVQSIVKVKLSPKPRLFACQVTRDKEVDRATPEYPAKRIMTITPMRPQVWCTFAGGGHHAPVTHSWCIKVRQV